MLGRSELFLFNEFNRAVNLGIGGLRALLVISLLELFDRQLLSNGGECLSSHIGLHLNALQLYVEGRLTSLNFVQFIFQRVLIELSIDVLLVQVDLLVLFRDVRPQVDAILSSVNKLLFENCSHFFVLRSLRLFEGIKTLFQSFVFGGFPL